MSRPSQLCLFSWMGQKLFWKAVEISISPIFQLYNVRLKVMGENYFLFLPSAVLIKFQTPPLCLGENIPAISFFNNYYSFMPFLPNFSMPCLLPLFSLSFAYCAVIHEHPGFAIYALKNWFVLDEVDYYVHL